VDAPARRHNDPSALLTQHWQSITPPAPRRFGAFFRARVCPHSASTPEPKPYEGWLSSVMWWAVYPTVVPERGDCCELRSLLASQVLRGETCRVAQMRVFAATQLRLQTCTRPAASLVPRPQGPARRRGGVRAIRESDIARSERDDHPAEPTRATNPAAAEDGQARAERPVWEIARDLYEMSKGLEEDMDGQTPVTSVPQYSSNSSKPRNPST
jgi:hypothetical protein